MCSLFRVFNPYITYLSICQTHSLKYQPVQSISFYFLSSPFIYAMQIENFSLSFRFFSSLMLPPTFNKTFRELFYYITFISVFKRKEKKRTFRTQCVLITHGFHFRKGKTLFVLSKSMAECFFSFGSFHLFLSVSIKYSKRRDKCFCAYFISFHLHSRQFP